MNICVPASVKIVPASVKMNTSMCSLYPDDKLEYFKIKLRQSILVVDVDTGLFCNRSQKISRRSEFDCDSWPDS